MSDWFRELDGDRLLLHIKAIPGASKTEPAGIKDSRLRFRIAAAPEAGKANAKLCAALAKLLGCTTREIILQSGEQSRLKTFSLPIAVRERLEQLGRGE
jgi:uncharacterized protein (TIGR00251 family)